MSLFDDKTACGTTNEWRNCVKVQKEKAICGFVQS